MLSFDMERYQFNKTIQEIKSLCTTSECDHAFLTDLQEQWEREDKNRRTIQGIEYETKLAKNPVFPYSHNKNACYT